LTIALAVVGLTPIGFAAFIGSAIWIAVTSMVLGVRGRRAMPNDVPRAVV
jgi:hypothetical protein